ncbi:MAG: hypothetical protein ABIS36_21230 [Chryseolinea sp.]
MNQWFTPSTFCGQILQGALYKMVDAGLKTFLRGYEGNPIRSYILESEEKGEFTKLTRAGQLSAYLNSLPLCQPSVPGALRKMII